MKKLPGAGQKWTGSATLLGSFEKKRGPRKLRQRSEQFNIVVAILIFEYKLHMVHRVTSFCCLGSLLKIQYRYVIVPVPIDQPIFV